jgi:hypothetical protein
MVEASWKLASEGRDKAGVEEDQNRRRRRQPKAEGRQMSKLNAIELKRAQLVPSAAFASPDAVVRSDALSLPQKIAILRRWEFDVRQGGEADGRLAVSAESRLLKAVRGALADLGAPAEPPASEAMPATH